VPVICQVTGTSRRQRAAIESRVRRLLEALVDQAYGLTEDEIAIVEGET